MREFVLSNLLGYLQGQTVSTEGQQQTSTEQDKTQGNNQQQNQAQAQSGGPQTGGGSGAPENIPPKRCSLHIQCRIVCHRYDS